MTIDLKSIQEACRLFDEHGRLDIETVRGIIEDPETERQVVEIADGGTTPGELDLADFYMLLSKIDSGGIAFPNGGTETCRRILRRTIYLPMVDLDDIKLTVVCRPNGDGSNTAMVKITPAWDDRKTPPDVFIGGIFQPAATYLWGAIEFARAEQNEIILVDAPSVGGSRLTRGTYLTYENIVRPLDSILAEAGGSIRYLMGHSMGTMPVRHEYHERRLKGKGGIEKYIVIAPTSTAEEVHASLRPSPYFSDDVFKQIARTGRAVTSHADIEAFMRNHEDGERREFEKIAMKEDVQFGSPFIFLRTMSLVSERPLLDYAGLDDKHLLIVVGREDELQQLNNPDAWEGRRGILVLQDGDHAFPAGEKTGVEFFRTLRECLSENLVSDFPFINQNESARWGSGRIGPVFQFTSEPHPHPAVSGGVGPTIDYQFGLNRWSGLLIGARTLASGARFFEEDSSTFGLQAMASAGLLVSPLPRTANWYFMPLQVGGGYDLKNVSSLPITAGLTAGYDVGNTGFHEIVYAEGGWHPVNETLLPFKAGIGVFWNMGGVGYFRIRAGGQFNLNEEQNPADPPTAFTIGAELMKALFYF